MKHILFICLAALLSAAGHASSTQQLPITLQGNWSAVDGSQTWVYGLHPTVAVWQNAFWDYAGVTTKGAVTTIRLRERDGDRIATLYARWNPKDSTAMIGLSPKNLTPYSQKLIVNPSYRIPAGEDRDYPGGDSVMRNGTALVRGYLKGYLPETMARTIKIYGFNTITGEDMPAVGDIGADGTFEMAMELGHPATAQIVLTGGGYGEIYVEPGDTLILCLDITRGTTAELREWYMGGNGRVNREMSRLKELYVPFEREDQMFLMRTTPDASRLGSMSVSPMTGRRR